MSTLEQIGAVVTLAVGLITGVGYIIAHLKKWLGMLLQDRFAVFEGKIDGINLRLDKVDSRIGVVDMETTKNHLVIFLAGVERGHEVDEIEKERFWEQYNHYKEIGGNSYVERRVNKLVDEHKL